MSMMVSFVLSFFPRDVLDEILNLIESVSEDFPSYSCTNMFWDVYKKWLDFVILLYFNFTRDYRTLENEFCWKRN